MSEEHTFKFETNNKKGSNPIEIKAGLIALTLIGLLILNFFLSGVVKERKNYREEAVQSVKTSWGASQTIYSPVLSLEKIQIKTKDEEKIEEKILEPFILENFDADVKLATEIRKKGIFKIPVYVADVRIKGNFKNNLVDVKNPNILFAFEVGNASGFINQPKIKLGDESPINLNDTQYRRTLTELPGTIPFELNYSIRGSEAFFVYMDAENNNIEMTSNWADPEFTGQFLPNDREISKDGFKANWSVPKVATKTIEGKSNTTTASVKLLTPVDNYRMTERAVKYAFLFLALTFLAFFVYEIVSKETKMIHPMQYLLMGGSMLIFYLLLVSISECLPFITAYLISSVLTILTIVGYTYFVITKKRSMRFSSLIGGLLAALYTYLYVMLTLQDLSLFMGSIGLFLVIILTMYATRNISWYGEE